MVGRNCGLTEVVKINGFVNCYTNWHYACCHSFRRNGFAGASRHLYLYERGIVPHRHFEVSRCFTHLRTRNLSRIHIQQQTRFLPYGRNDTTSLTRHSEASIPSLLSSSERGILHVPISCSM